MSSPVDPDDFLSVTSSYKDKQRARTATYNYVATVRKPTAVTHSCVGSFTGPNASNLILCKGSVVEIFLIVENELKPIFEFPLYEKVVFLVLSRPSDASMDYLFIATELHKFCVYSWDVASSKLITIKASRYPSPKLLSDEWMYCQGGTVCPRSARGCTVILYASNAMRVIKTNDFHTFSTYAARLKSFILDMKFLYGSGPSTVALLGKKRDGDGDGDTFSVKVFEISDDTFTLKNWGLPMSIDESTLLIPVDQFPYGFVIILRKTFTYVTELSSRRTKPMGYFNIKAYGRFLSDTNKHCYLLGDHDGRLLMIELPDLTHRLLGVTSKPSSLTYLSDSRIFVGSCSSDSQIIKLHHLGDLEVLNTYSNSGPISGFCVINKSGGRRKALMCGGALDKGVLEVFSTSTGIVIETVPIVIFYKNKKLQYKALNLPDVSDSSPFRCDNFPDGLVIAMADRFVFCKLGEVAESGRIPIISYGRRICHQEETESYAIITEEKQQQQTKSNLVLLLDGNLNTLSTYELAEHEVGLTVVNCQFHGDENTYYCVGTSFEDDPNNVNF